jgi:hypothetical protein
LTPYGRLRLRLLVCRRRGDLDGELLEVFIVGFTGLDGGRDLLSALFAVFLSPLLEELIFGLGGFLLRVVSDLCVDEEYVVYSGRHE